MIGSPAGELEIVVSLLCEVSLTLRDPAEADAFTVLDELGEELELEPVEPGQGRRARAAGGDPQAGGALRAGVWGPFQVSEEAERIVLYRAGRPVREVRIGLDPARPNLLEI